MCGVPIHAAQDYLKKLIALGHRVAICEQVEDPAEAKKRGGKSPVKRDVVRLVTARHAHRRRSAAAARLQLSRRPRHAAPRRNRFRAGLRRCLDRRADRPADSSADALADELARIDPAELLLTDATRAALGRAEGAAARCRHRHRRRRSLRFDRRRGRSSPAPSTSPAVDPTAYLARRARRARRPARLYRRQPEGRRRWRCGRRRPNGCNATWRSTPPPAPRSNCSKPSAAAPRARC